LNNEAHATSKWAQAFNEEAHVTQKLAHASYLQGRTLTGACLRHPKRHVRLVQGGVRHFSQITISIGFFNISQPKIKFFNI
jgi:hypothetical protein